jgi:hypothetical protein
MNEKKEMKVKMIKKRKNEIKLRKWKKEIKTERKGNE